MSSNRLYIGRLSYQAREKDVERFFRGFGRMKDINLKNGFGFVVRGLKFADNLALPLITNFFLQGIRKFEGCRRCRV